MDEKCNGYRPLELNEKIMLVPTLGTRSYFIGKITSIENAENLGAEEKMITVVDAVRNLDNPETLSFIWVKGNYYLETNDGFRYNIIRDIDDPNKIQLLLRKIVLLSDKLSEKNNFIEYIKNEIFKIPDLVTMTVDGKYVSYDNLNENKMLDKWREIYKTICDINASLPFNMTRSGEII